MYSTLNGRFSEKEVKPEITTYFGYPEYLEDSIPFQTAEKYRCVSSKAKTRRVHGPGVKTSPVQRETKYSIAFYQRDDDLTDLKFSKTQLQVLRKETEEQEQQNQTNLAARVNL